MKRTTKRVLIALDLAKLDSPGLVSFARSIATGLTGNKNLAAADVAKLPFQASDLQTAATALETTHTSRPTSPSKASTKTEGDQASTLMDELTDVARFIEGIANVKAAGDATLAEAIIVSVGFQTKKAAVRHPKGFEAASLAKGTALVHVPSGDANGVKLLQYSTDGGKTWSLPIIVHGMDITLTGMKSGVDYLFQMATSSPPPKKTKATMVSGSEAQAWSDSVSCMIM
jgi:hypothetical protein